MYLHVPHIGVSRPYGCSMISARAYSILFVVPIVALSACGGKSFKADPAADLAVAKQAVLTAADLPGYKATPHTSSDDIPAGVKKDFANCMGTATSVFDDTPGAQKADSPDFSSADQKLQVSGTVEVDPSKSDIDNGWSEISKAGTEPCLGKLFEAAAHQGALAGPGISVRLGAVTRFDVGVGDRSVGYSVPVHITGPGGSISVYLDFVFLPRDRAGMDFSFTNIGSPPGRGTETALVKKVYDRVGNQAK
jgi:hypothetical protein